ncbi:YetF domain-containing protein [Gloeocapsa sp. BRSZ]
MQKQRVTQAQLLAAVRENRICSLQEVEAIVMESAGTIAVIKKKTDGELANSSVLDNIPRIY